MAATTRSARLAGVAGLCLSFSVGLAVAQADGVQAGAERKGVVPAHAAFCSQCNHGEGLPAYDVRVDDALFGAIATAEAQGTAEKALGAAATLRATVPMLAIDFDESLGTPKFIRSTAGFLTGPRRGESWAAVVGGFATANRGLVGFGPDELTRNRVIRDFTMKHNGVRHVTVQQVHAGVDVFGATLRVSLTGAGELIGFSSTMLDRPAEGFSPSAVKLTAAQAAVLAAADAGVKIDESELAIAEEESGADRRAVWTTPAALRPDEPLETRLVYFPLTRTTLVPAWTVVVAQHGLGHTYDVVIDAADGKVLSRTNRLVCAAPITFNVFTNDSPAPLSPGYPAVTNSQASFVPRELVTVNPVDVAAWSPQGWIPDGTFETLGNNVDAHTDTNADNSPDLPRPDGGAGLVFDFPVDLSLDPSQYKDAAVTQMFYWCNLFHDRLYELGFTETAGNFQNDNFGQGGAGGDRVRADVQDGTGFNNANFSTSGSDGSGARVQMYLWSGPNPDRDGAFESDIVYHELAHGVSIRLHGGLSAIQSAGMGEGWSDFIGMSLNSKPGDDPDAVYTTGPYVTHQLSGLSSNYYFGIRRYPYSTNMAKGPLTFGDIDTALYNVPGTVARSPIASGNSDVHDYGEVWCQILWECRAAMVHAHGYPGNQMMLQLVIDGMAQSPGNPTFVQARDSILLADQTNNGGANYGRLWTAFAKRGIGFGAAAPAATTTSGVTESFTVPIFATFSFPDGLPSQLSPTSPTSFHVSVSGTGLTVTPDSGTLSYRVNGGSFTTVEMTQTGASEYMATLPSLPCLAKVDYYVGVGTSAGNRTSPASAPSAFNSATVYTSLVTLASDTFETATAWTAGPNTATAGNWLRGNPIGTAAQPEDDHTAAPGANCWFTGQGTTGGAIGDADVDGGQTVLVSPAYDLSSLTDATVSYWRWYANGEGATPFTDTFRVYASVNNGTNWTLAETVGPADSVDTNPGWRFASWTLSSLGLTPSSQVRVRFIAEDANAGSLVEAAVDDFAITGLVCVGVTPCGPADIGSQGGLAGASGTLDNNDFIVFIDAFFNQLPVADVGRQGGLIGSDGAFDNNDFIAFIELFFTGC